MSRRGTSYGQAHSEEEELERLDQGKQHEKKTSEVKGKPPKVQSPPKDKDGDEVMSFPLGQPSPGLYFSPPKRPASSAAAAAATAGDMPPPASKQPKRKISTVVVVEPVIRCPRCTNPSMEQLTSACQFYCQKCTTQIVIIDECPRQSKKARIGSSDADGGGGAAAGSKDSQETEEDGKSLKRADSVPLVSPFLPEEEDVICGTAEKWSGLPTTTIHGFVFLDPIFAFASKLNSDSRSRVVRRFEKHFRDICVFGHEKDTSLIPLAKRCAHMIEYFGKICGQK
jgi:hypothetical protein